MRKEAIKRMIGKAKVKDMLPLLKIIAGQWQLKLGRKLDFEIAHRILINSVLNN